MFEIFRQRKRRAAVPSFLALLLFSGCKSGSEKPAGPPAPAAASVSRVQRGNISHLLSVAGRFQPYQVIDVHAKVSGYVRHIYVDIGDRVHVGQLLADLEVPELNAQYRGTQSEELRSKDQIQQAQHEVGRAQALHASLQANYDRLQSAAKAQPGLIAARSSTTRVHKRTLRRHRSTQHPQAFPPPINRQLRLGRIKSESALCSSTRE